MIEKKVIFTGATGMVGGLALRICLDSPDVSQVTAIGRSRTGIEHARLREIMVDDFSDYSKMANAFENQDAALFCLGVYTGAVPDDLFRKITSISSCSRYR
jgi:nucleoside-diphosphate-sugar epimerase